MTDNRLEQLRVAPEVSSRFETINTAVYFLDVSVDNIPAQTITSAQKNMMFTPGNYSHVSITGSKIEPEKVTHTTNTSNAVVETNRFVPTSNTLAQTETVNNASDNVSVSVLDKNSIRAKIASIHFPTGTGNE